MKEYNFYYLLILYAESRHGPSEHLAILESFPCLIQLGRGLSLDFLGRSSQ